VTSTIRPSHLSTPNGERILLTGGLGFIGAHVLRAYLAHGCHVAVLDDASHGRPEHLPPGVPFYQVDVRDGRGVMKALETERPEVINHHAALVSVRESHLDPTRYLEVNAQGTANVLRAAIECGARKFILASSGGAVYGNARRLPVGEDHPLAPLSPYGASKVRAERHLLSGPHSFEYVILRYGNVYGPGQHPDGNNGVVAIFTRQLLDGKVPQLYGAGHPLRDFVYVDDVAQANLGALAPGVRGVFNVGTGRGLRIAEVYARIAACLGIYIAPQMCPAHEFEVAENVLAVERAALELGWVAHTLFEDGLRRTVAWVQTLVADAVDAGAVGTLSGDGASE
jgi:UDP-glucose 4-epimerase